MQNIIHRRKGFTLVEILVVVTLLSALIGVLFYSTDIGKRKEAIDKFGIKIFAEKSLPEAITSAYFSNGNKLAGVTKGDLEAAGSLGNPPDGISWSVGTITADTIVIHITTASSVFANNLKEGIRTSGGISSVGVNGKTLDITYSI